MRISYLSDSTLFSGTANIIHVIKMSQALATQGHQVVLHVRAGSFPSDCYHEIAREYGVHPLFKLKVWRIGEFKGSCYIYGFLSGIYAWFSGSSLAYCRSLPASVVAYSMGLKTIVELHQPLASTQPAWFVSLLLYVWGRSHKIRFVVITEALKNYLELKYPECHTMIKVAPDAADEHPAGARPLTFLKSDKQINVGYCGHLYPGKGVELILKLVPLCPWANFHVVGGTDHDLAKWKFIANSEMFSNLTWHGRVPHADVPCFLSSFDVALLPMQWRVATSASNNSDIASWTSPLKLFEYMAAGLPIVASDLPVLREVLKHEVNSLLCNALDPFSWQRQLERLRDCENLRLKLGVQQRKSFFPAIVGRLVLKKCCCDFGQLTVSRSELGLRWVAI